VGGPEDTRSNAGQERAIRTLSEISHLPPHIQEADMKKAVIAGAIMIILTTVGFSANADDKWKRALAEELLEQTNVKENTQASFDLIKQMVTKQLRAVKPPQGQTAAPKELADQLNKILDVVAEEFSWESMREDYINLYAGLFTEEELKDLIAFYRSPAGRAFVKKQPELMKRTLEMTQRKVADILPRIAKMGPSAAEKSVPATPGKRFLKADFR
jgi:uncharacterized protein